MSVHFLYLSFLDFLPLLNLHYRQFIGQVPGQYAAGHKNVLVRLRKIIVHRFGNFNGFPVIEFVTRLLRAARPDVHYLEHGFRHDSP